MWLSRKLSQHEMQDVASAQDGTVTVEGGELAVFSSGETVSYTHLTLPTKA